MPRCPSVLYRAARRIEHLSDFHVGHALEIVQQDSSPFFLRQSADCFKQQLRRDFLSRLLIARLGFFVLKILVKRVKLPLLMQGKVGNDTSFALRRRISSWALQASLCSTRLQKL